MKSVLIEESAYRHLCSTVGAYTPETGAMLGAAGGTLQTVSAVWFDEPATTERRYYHPTASAMEQIAREWRLCGISFCGLVHSHIDIWPDFSLLDKRSAAAIMQANGMSEMLMGLFCKGTLKMELVRQTSNGLTWEPLQVEIVRT